MESTSDSEPLGAFADEWDELTTELNRWGVLHVAPGMPHASQVSLSATSLFGRLWKSMDPRLQQAGVVLLLTHPELASEARAAIRDLEGVPQERAKWRYVAAAALQRMAKTRIALRLGSRPLLSEAYLDELGLPSLDKEFGRETLLALAHLEQDRFGYDAWGTYRALLDHFLSDIRRQDWGLVCEDSPTGTA
jgi:hypothetical protein